MSNQNQEYGKKLTVTLSDGSTKVFEKKGQPEAFLKLIDNNSRFVKIKNDDDSIEYYDIGSASCGFCLVAKVEPTVKDVDNTPCEDALPADCEDESKAQS